MGGMNLRYVEQGYSTKRYRYERVLGSFRNSLMSA